MRTQAYPVPLPAAGRRGSKLKPWEGQVDARGGLTELVPETPPEWRYAFIGARSCDLHAKGILERVIGPASAPRSSSWCSAAKPGEPASASR